MHGGLLGQAFIYLVAAVISVPIARRLGLGSVLGYLIAGIIIGPHIMHLVGGNTGDVMHFAEFGVVMMLFLIGLELQPALLWRMRAPILGLGGLQVIGTAAIITLVAIGFGLVWQMAVAIGCTLALSSTAIVLQSLGEKGQLKTEGGQAAFSVLLFQDIAVIPMLAAFPLLATLTIAGENDGHDASLIAHLPGYFQALVVIAAVAGIVIAGRFLGRPIFRFIAQTRLPELFTAFALLLVIGIALAMQSIGLSPALGTFVAGVVLADNEYRHELEADIEPFKGLLLGLFFITVGASIDFDLILASPGMIAALVGALIAVKFIVLFILGRVFRMDMSANLMFAFSLAQGGEFGFVLFGFATQSGVLPQDVTAPLIAVVALSMALTPLIMIVNDRLIQPRFRGAVKKAEPDKIEDTESQVLIAGYGRFGQIVGRLLIANGFTCTILDHDPSQIDMLRKFGVRVFYGDASRVDLLHSAGAYQAKLIVLAIDDRTRAVAMTEEIKKEFPNTKVLARAFDRRHVYELLAAGADYVNRETFGSALDTGVEALIQLGFGRYQAHRAALKFKHMDHWGLKQMQTYFGDDENYVIQARQTAAYVEKVLRSDEKESRHLSGEHAWEDATARERRLIEEARDHVVE